MSPDDANSIVNRVAEGDVTDSQEDLRAALIAVARENRQLGERLVGSLTVIRDVMKAEQEKIEAYGRLHAWTVKVLKEEQG